MPTHRNKTREDVHLVSWVQENAELFGYMFTRAVADALKNGIIASLEDAPKWLATNRQTFYQWRAGTSTPDDLRLICERLPTLWQELIRLADIGEDKPVEDARWNHLWKERTSHELNDVLHEDSWAWVFPWPGLTIDRVSLAYNAAAKYDLPLIAEKALTRWSQDHPHRASELLNEATEGWGTQMRLEGITRSAGHGEPEKYKIAISRTRFLFYAAIQARLGTRDRELVELRNACFENAVEGLIRGTPLQLPSVFAIHMAAVTSDKKALLRLRRPDTPMFPNAWECSVGEMMHGPNYKGAFPHFDHGEPSLQLFLKNAVAEELGYFDSQPIDFRLYGFAAEYLTLAPKLIVIYTSTASADVLRKGAKSPTTEDAGMDSAIVDLTPEAVASAMRKYPLWGPTSKLALMVALLSTEPSEPGKQRLKDEVKDLLGR